MDIRIDSVVAPPLGATATVRDASGEVHGMPLPNNDVAPGAAVDAAHGVVAAAPADAVDATPRPKPAREAARDEHLLGGARAQLAGWRSYCEGRPPPSVDPLDPSSAIEAAAWRLADVTRASGIDPRTTSPLNVGAALAERVGKLVMIVAQMKTMSDALDTAVATLRYYERDALASARAEGRVSGNDDDGRRATATLGELHKMGVI